MSGEPRIMIVPDEATMSLMAANIVASTLEADPGVAISLPTGTTPLGMFQQLIDRSRHGSLDVSQLQLFCLDEYVGVDADEPNSLTGWLTRELIEPAGISLDHVHTLPVTDEDLEAAARSYEAEIESAGGLELVVLGLGGNGHVAYNEPGAARDSRTRVIELTPESVTQATGYFEGRQVPTRAMTVGIGTLLEARRIVLIVTGAAKAEILKRALRGPMTADVPASWLRLAGNRVTVIADRAAGATIG